MRHSETVLQQSIPQAAASMLERLRARSPRVHCITNSVAQTFTANALLAAGCVPSMTLAAEEIGAFVGKADALLVNLGTFDAGGPCALGIPTVMFGASGGVWPTGVDFVTISDVETEARILAELIVDQLA